MLTQHLVRTVALHLEQDFGATVGALFRLQDGLRSRHLVFRLL